MATSAEKTLWWGKGVGVVKMDTKPLTVRQRYWYISGLVWRHTAYYFVVGWQWLTRGQSVEKMS